MILAILPDTSKTESLLNNLSEADFNLDDVSVMMQDIALRDRIAQDTGPLKGVLPTKLAPAWKKAGASKDVAQKCSDAISQGKILVAMNVDPKYQPAALQMFKDMSAEILQE